MRTDGADPSAGTTTRAVPVPSRPYSSRPSGDQAGGPVIPALGTVRGDAAGSTAATRRSVVSMSVSHASELASGDQAGQSPGSPGDTGVSRPEPRSRTNTPVDGPPSAE